MMLLTTAFLLLSAFSCGGGNKANTTNEQSEKIVVNVPQFDADSAYLYVKNQVDFGPRVPNTKGHVACGNYLAQQLKEFGAQVTDQYADLIAYDGTLLKARNIIGSYKPESKTMILTKRIINHLFSVLMTEQAGWELCWRLPVWFINSNRSLESTSFFLMRKIMERTIRITKSRGVWEHSIGRAILMFKDTMPVSEFCLIW